MTSGFEHRNKLVVSDLPRGRDWAVPVPREERPRDVVLPIVFTKILRLRARNRQSLRGISMRRRFQEPRLGRYEISNREVLISVALSVCGEVAEWPKAAVC